MKDSKNEEYLDREGKRGREGRNMDRDKGWREESKRGDLENVLAESNEVAREEGGYADASSAYGLGDWNGLFWNVRQKKDREKVEVFVNDDLNIPFLRFSQKRNSVRRIDDIKIAYI